MTLQSMTGFARIEGASDNLSWVWELRSVNGKGLDLRFRIPSGFEVLEIPARKLAQHHLKRGNVQTSLQITHKDVQKNLKVDEALIEQLISVARQVKEKTGGEMPDAADLLQIKGVFEVEESDNSALGDETVKTILESLEEALKQLVAARGKEGSQIGNVLLDHVSSIEAMLGSIENDASRKPEAIRNVLKTQVERLLPENSDFDEQRLHQEAVLLATKADINEELDRLKVHVNSARELITEGGAIGRKLDFLAQEFNRECNTICSKSNSSAVTGVGLDMKLVIDQFREQLQNME